MGGLDRAEQRACHDGASNPGSVRARVDRLRKYNGTYEGFAPITELARARSIERFDTRGLLGPYRAEVETDLADAARYMAASAPRSMRTILFGIPFQGMVRQMVA